MSWWKNNYLARKLKEAVETTKKIWDELFSSSDEPDFSADDAIVEFLSEVTDTNFEEAKKRYEEKLNKLDRKNRRIVDDLKEEIGTTEFIPANYSPAEVAQDVPDNPLRLGLRWHQCGLDVHASSNVFAFAYDYGYENLHIIFLNIKEEEAFLTWFPANSLGYVYPRYYIFQKITEEKFREFLGSDSYGSWVWENIIRDSEYNSDWIIDIWSPRTVNPNGLVNDPKTVM